jgi:GAF domain-containing protein
MRDLSHFDQALAQAASSQQCWRALQDLYDVAVGHRLFTVMKVDMKKEEACRAYTSHPAEYPVSGTKLIRFDAWFDVVHRQQRMFIANTIKEIAEVFPDHEKILSMGCGSVVNIPVVIEGELAATINILHAEHHYTPERVALIEQHLVQPSLRAYRAAGKAWI